MDSIKLFLEHLRIDRGSSPHTIAAYERDLRQFDAHYCHKVARTSLENVQETDVESFLKELRAREQKSTSIARKVSALKQFYKFLVKEGVIKDNPTLFIEAPVQATKLPKTLQPADIEALLKVVDEGSHTEHPTLGKRDRAMLYLLYATGMRVSELLSLKLSHTDTEGGFVRVMGKRSKERMIPFAPIAGEHVLTYLQKVRPTFEPKSDELFLGQGGHPLTRQAFWKTLKKIALHAGLSQSLHPHLLRHTFATDLLRSGMNLRSLQMLLGHADLQTTQIYTHVAPERLKEVIDQYHPRGGKRGKRE
jgi:integrase/recombinase XerD